MSSPAFLSLAYDSLRETQALTDTPVGHFSIGTAETLFNRLDSVSAAFRAERRGWRHPTTAPRDQESGGLPAVVVNGRRTALPS
jgi:hypothetical protein